MKNQEIVEQVDAAFAANDLEGFLVHCAEDVVWTMVGEATNTGKDAIRQWMKPMIMPEPPKLTREEVIAEGDSVAARGRMTIKGKDGQDEAHAYCDFYQFRAGKIVAMTSFVRKINAKGNPATA